MINSTKCKFYTDPNYYEYLVEYRGDLLGELEKIDYACGYILNFKFAILSVKSGLEKQVQKDVPSILFINFRNMFVLQDITSLSTLGTSAENTSNIIVAKNNPYLFLSGTDVIVGIIDTGIDYLNKEFQKEDGTTRIETLWDQTTVGSDSSSDVFIGTTYSSMDINKALEAQKKGLDPYSIVPSQDTIGHGTQLAGIVGARGYNKEFRGIAHDCSFAIVKLIESAAFKNQLKKNNNDTHVYNSAEIVAGFEYLKEYTKKVKKPMVILLGLGSSDYSHDGTELLSKYVDSLTSYRGMAVVCGTGNEGLAESHTTGFIKNIGEIHTSELSVNTIQDNLAFKIWVRKPNVMSLNVISPSGQSTNFILAKKNKSQKIKFIAENTTLNIDYYLPYNITGLETIVIEFNDIKPGIWKFQLRGDYITDGRYDIWLPPFKTLPPGIKFLNPNPQTTLNIVSSAKKVITTSYYNQNTNTIINESGKGFPLSDYIKPDITAPGFNILTTSLNNTITTTSGSSVAAAIVAGVCALLFQWGIINKNDPTMFSTKLIYYLISGASRNSNENYPNENWGYGKLDLTGIFKTLTGSRILKNKSNSNYIEYTINNLFVRLPTELEDNYYD